MATTTANGSEPDLIDGFLNILEQPTTSDECRKLMALPNGQRVTTCYYRDYRDADNEHSKVWFHVVMAKLLFIIAFEHLVLLVQVILGYLIPDVPDNVVIRLQREAFLQHQAFKEHELGRGEHKDGDEVDELMEDDTSPEADASFDVSDFAENLPPGVAINQLKENGTAANRAPQKRPFILAVMKKIMFC